MGFTTTAFPDFTTSAAAVLDHLQRRLGFDCWVITRDDDDARVTLRCTPGDERWVDGFAKRMIRADGSAMVPRARHSPAMAEALMAVMLSGRRVRIGAYLTVPLLDQHGGSLGTLCAIHPAAVPDQNLLEHPLVELLARLLATMLERERAR